MKQIFGVIFGIISVIILVTTLCGCHGSDEETVRPSSVAENEDRVLTTLTVKRSASFFGQKIKNEDQPTEWPLENANGQSVEFGKLSDEVLAVFVDTQDRMIETSSSRSSALKQFSPKLGEMFLVKEPATIPIPYGAKRLLFMPTSKAESEIKLGLRIVNTPSRQSAGNFMTRLVRLKDDGYTIVEPSELQYREEFYVEAVFESEPTGSQQIIWLQWDGEPQKQIVVNKDPFNPLILRSEPFTMTKKVN